MKINKINETNNKNKEKNKNKRSFKHLSYEERVTIEYLFNNKESIRYIGLILKRPASTISNEIKRNSVNGIYTADKAKHKARVKRMYSKGTCLKVVMNKFIRDLVDERLKDKWSPREISGYLKNNHNINCSAKAIYTYTDKYCLEHLLFWSWNKRKGGRKYKKNDKLNDNRKYIEERPNIITKYDWEMDFIISRQSKSVLLVLVNRLTKYTLIEKLPNRKHSTIKRVLSTLSNYHSMKTITTDNDIAFNNWKQLEYIIHGNIYFCHPYHSWEKGLVENTNRWIRCFIPKRKDISLATNEDLKQIDAFINHKPRAINNFVSPFMLQFNKESVLFEG
jgi:IS30 family transposase